MAAAELIVRHLGLVDYLPTLEAMRTLTAERDETTSDEIWLLQHPQVFTQGQAGKPEHLLAPGDIPVVQVERGGHKIHLTPREYALLEFLAFHRGRVVTRTMIWEHLYDEYDENTSNVVDVYIRYLRNKIDKGFDPPLILTKWGEGYMLRGDDPAPHNGNGPHEKDRPRSGREKK